MYACRQPILVSVYGGGAKLTVIRFPGMRLFLSRTHSYCCLYMLNQLQQLAIAIDDHN